MEVGIESERTLVLKKYDRTKNLLLDTSEKNMITLFQKRF